MKMKLTKYINKSFLAGMLLITTATMGQSWNMMNGDTLFINGCLGNGTIYDDGGPTDDYSNSFEGWVVIEASVGSTITLSGNYQTESSSYDWFDAWDGDSTNGTQIANRVGGTGTMSLTATSGKLTLKFRSDYSVVRSGFALTYTVTGADVTGGVTDLTATNITKTGATLTWNSTSSGPFHVLLDGVEIGTSNTYTYTLSGLNPSRRYRVRVFPDGMETNGCSYDNTMFRTACGEVTLPWLEDFREYTVGSMPPCWTKSVNFDDEETQPRLVNLSGSYGNSLMLSCGSNSTGGHYGLVVGPPSFNDAQQWMISFDYRVSHSYTSFVIGVCDTTSSEYQEYGFIPIDSITEYSNNYWYHYRSYVTIPSGGCRIAFRMVQNRQSGGIGHLTYIDNLQIETCGVDGSSVSRTDTSSIIINWTSFNSPTVNIGVRHQGATEDDTVIVGATSPQLIDGLSPDTYYTLTFYPICDNITHLPYTTTIHTLPAEGIPTTMCSSYDNYLYNGNYIITSQLAALDGKEVLFSYNTTSNYYPTAQDQIIVGTCTYPDDFSSFTPFDTINDIAYDTWKQTTVRVPDECTDRFLAFLGSYQSISHAHIKNISVNNCHVINSRLVNIFGTRAIVAWDSPISDSVIIDYYSSYDYIHYYDTVVGATQHTITGLRPDCYYYFNIYRPCGDPCSLYSFSGRTALRDYELPLCEDFETTGSMFSNINGWYYYNTYNGCPYRSSSYAHEGWYSMELASFNGTNEWQYDLIMPNISGMAGQVLSFWGVSFAPSSQLILSSWDGIFSNSHYHSFDTINIIGDGSLHHYSVILPDTLSGRVTMRYQLSGMSGSYYLWIDDIQLGAAGYSDFTFTNLEAHAIDLVWQGINADAAWARLVSENNDVFDVIGNTDTLHFAGLDSNTHYYCYLAPINNDDTLCFSFLGSFATPMYSPSSDGEGEGSGIISCNSFDDLPSGSLPGGWIFSDSAAVTILDSIMQVTSGATPDTITLPALQGSALYIAARGLSGTDTLFVDGDTTILDTVWRYFCYEPNNTYGHRIQLRVTSGTATGGCQFNNVGFSSCPIIDFTPNGNSLLCQVRGGFTCEYILTLTDEEGLERSYHVTSSNFTIDNLPPSTHFTARWQCLYMGDECMPTLSVHTASIPLPYCTNLYGLTDLLEGWKVIGESNDHFQGGNYSYFRFYSDYSTSYSPDYHLSDSHWQYIILPETENYTSLSATVYGLINSSLQTMQIGILTNPADTSSFVPAATFSYSDNYYQNYSADLSQLPHGRVAIRNKAGYLYLGNIELVEAPILSYHMYHYDTLTVLASSPSEYRLEHAFTNSNSSYYFYNTTIDDVDTIVYGLPAFDPSHNYLGVRQLSANGSFGCSSYPQFFPIHNTATIPYCQDFQSSESNGFFYLSGDNCYEWNRTYDYNNDSYNYYIYTYVSSRKYMTFPYLLVDSLNTLSGTFRYLYNYSSGTTHPLVVGVLPEAMDTNGFVAVDTIYMIGDNQWHTATFSLSSYHGDGHWLALCDLYNYYSHSLYLDDVKIDVCLSALTPTVELERYNIVRVDNTVDDPFYAEYGPSGFIPGEGTLKYIDTTPYRLTLLPDTSYDFYFYCTATGSPCSTPQTVQTLSLPFSVPTCIDFDTNSTEVTPARWTSVSGSSAVSDSVSRNTGNSLMVAGIVSTPDIDLDSLQQMALDLWVMSTDASTRLVVGTMTNPTDAASFHALKTIIPEQTGIWEHHFVSFKNAPNNAHFVALRNSTGDHSTLFVDDIHLSLCGGFDVQVDHVDNNSIDLSWSEVGTPTISLAVDDGDNISSYTLSGGSFSLPIMPLHSYTLAFHSECESSLSCNVNYDDTIRIIAPTEGMGCVNPTDLQSPQAVFFSGTYGNPYAQAGAIDLGSRSPESRHTVCYDTSERDIRTGGLLRTIPEGYTSSVRLGNWGTNPANPEAEGVIYSLTVDTLNFNLLMMRYAAVLQDPRHATEDQPRFRLELLDSTFNVIDPVCAVADFIANRNLGWNEAEDNVLWKDWTPVGIDVSAYAGQQIFLRLTTYDCNEGSHYGYAYFTLECMQKTIDGETCGPVDSNRFTAPAGFNYRWYTSTDNSTIGTDRVLVVPTSDMATYFCDLSFVGNSACSFTLSAYGGPRLPLARCDTVVTISDCGFDVQFINQSTISADGINPAPSGEQVESAFWDFGNGETSNNYHARTSYSAPGTYTVTLIIGISGGECTDTLVWPMTLDFPTHPHIVGSQELCNGIADTLRLYDGTPTGDSLWSQSTDHWYLPVNPSDYHVGNNNYSVATTDQWGCAPTASHTVKVNPVYRHMDTITICNPLLPYSYADTVFLEGTTSARYDLDLTTVAGCDSSYHLWLSVTDTSAGTYRDTTLASICDNQSYLFYGTAYTDSGRHAQVHLNSEGFCDSIHTLRLEVRPTSAVDTIANQCDQFIWYGITYSTDTAVARVDTNTVLCDSTTTLHLTLRHSSDTTVTHSIIENELPYLWNGITFFSDTTGYLLTLPNHESCDSLITFNLVVFANSDTTVDSALCEGLLPMEWNGVSFSLAEMNPATLIITHQATLTTLNGADSVVTMRLHVLQNTTATVSDTIRQNDIPAFVPPLPVPVAYTQSESDPPLVKLIDTTMVIANTAGCDSTVHYTLYLYRNYFTEDSAECCDNKLPYMWESHPLMVNGSTTDTLTSAYATDSVVTFSLTIHLTYDVGDTIIVCPNRPFAYEGIDYGGPIDFDSPHLSVQGCDSLVHVSLQARDSSFRLAPEVMLDSSNWMTYDTTLLGCQPTQLQLRDNSSSISRIWTFWNTSNPADVQSGTDTLFTSLVDSLGSFSFQLVAISKEGCSDTVRRDSLLWVFTRPIPSFIWEPDHLSIHHPEVQFFNQTTTPSDSLPPYTTFLSAPTYLWLFPLAPGASSCDSSFEVNPYYSWEINADTGEYPVSLIAYLIHEGPDSLTITCTDTATIPIRIVNTYLQFPNLVTPNGDGTNDRWKVVNLLEMGEYSMNELWIYDRWGVEVYHVKNISKESDFWDPEETHSPDGTYYFRFMAKNNFGVVKRNGVIEVVR